MFRKNKNNPKDQRKDIIATWEHRRIEFLNKISQHLPRSYYVPGSICSALANIRWELGILEA